MLHFFDYLNFASILLGCFISGASCNRQQVDRASEEILILEGNQRQGGKVKGETFWRAERCEEKGDVDVGLVHMMDAPYPFQKTQAVF